MPITAPNATPAIGQIIQLISQLFPMKLQARYAAVIRHQYAPAMKPMLRLYSLFSRE